MYGEVTMQPLLDQGRSSAGDEPSSEDPSILLLDSLSELAARHFASTAEAIEAVLRAICEHMGTRSSFLTRITRNIGQSEVLAAFNAPDGCGIVAGSVLQLPQTF
jgi:hypothetical protein